MAGRQDVFLHGSSFGVNATPSAIAAAIAAFGPSILAYPSFAPGVNKPSNNGTNTSYTPYGITPAAYPTTGGAFGNIVSGVLTISNANTVIDGWNIPARVVVAANNVTVRRSILRGGSTITSGNDVGLFENDGHWANAVLEDSLLQPTNPSAWLNGVRGDNLTVQRCAILDCCDGMDLYSMGSGNPSNTFIYSNFISNLAGFDPDSIGRPFSHNDCIQITDGIGITIVGNTLLGFLNPAIGQASEQAPNYNTNSCIQLTQGTGVVTGLLIDRNWADGGGASFNLINTGQAARNIGSVTNNIFGCKQTFQGGSPGVDGSWCTGGDNTVTALSQGGLSYTDHTGNVYEANGHAINFRIS